MKKIKDFHSQPDFAKLEHKVLDYWDESGVFEKSISNRSSEKSYIFYDGPPFATGTPHYGHLLASTIKDTIPRYWTMKGYRVERVWGWDCHGLPIENMIEKKLDLKGGKIGIEKLGIDKFNSACRAAILRFDKDWEKVIRRLGRWVDFKNSYKTMDNSYMESVWWGFKELFDKDLVYEGRKVILYCPRCATPLSNFEIAMDNSYKMIEDNSVYVKFKIKNTKNEYLMAWTTTPWTLIGNVALAVDEKANYLKIKDDGDEIWVAEPLLHKIFGKEKSDLKITEEKKGKDLVGMEYEPLYNYMPTRGKKAHYVAGADFVSLEDGTGIVHTAAIFGEDDYALAQKLDLPRVPTLDDQGKFLSFVKPIAGVFYKKSEDWIIADLESRNLMFRAEKTTHSYPFCYRCNTPLYFNAIPAWFINIQKMKADLLKQNKNINWYPGHLKNGRFGKGLEMAPDWNISRSRYWGTPIPIWVDKKTKKIRVIGSLEELKTWAVEPSEVEKLDDMHREHLDDMEVWVDDEKTIKGSRVPEVFDCWVESGSMPFASIHYPFENKEKFEKSYPAQFISEYIAQTRAWFYTLHTLSVGIFGKPAFENAVATGTIMAEDGTKMSKSKKNFPDPMVVVEKHGVDSLRLYLMGSPLMKAKNLDFSEKGVGEIKKRIFNIWWNVFAFYKIYAPKPIDTTFPKSSEIEHVMDRWIVSRITNLTKTVTTSMDKYDVVTASRAIMEFVDELSTKYLRESRNRLRNKKENSQALQVFGAVLKRLSLLASPIVPFFTESLYQNLLKNPKESIHLEDWPIADEDHIDKKLEDEITLMFQIAEKAHALRHGAGIKLRQPLSTLTYKAEEKLNIETIEVLMEEINVENVKWKNMKGSDIKVELDTDITDELKEKGEAREVVRNIQTLRKTAGVSFDELVSVQLTSWPKKYEKEIMKKALVKKLTKGKVEKII
ncbi:isoleucine--tRNA ligase [Candidatus Microgenomates bacterium]|nr:isoleucine--tRNA ligase [Candidatus Microgenomates bacterium]